MEHFVEFAINIDDKTIQKRLEENAYDDICNKLIEEAKSSLQKRSGLNYYKEIDWQYMVGKQLKKFVEDNREEIIDAAAEKLKESFTRTKIYREKMKEVIE